MIKINKIKKIAETDGMNDAQYDISNKKIKRYNEIDYSSIISKLYDYYYVKSYNKNINKMFKKNKDISL